MKLTKGLTKGLLKSTRGPVKLNEETRWNQTRKPGGINKAERSDETKRAPTNLKIFRNRFGEFEIKSYICNEFLGSFKLVV